MIVRAAGTANVRFKYIVFRGNLTINNFNRIIHHRWPCECRLCYDGWAVRYYNTPAYGISPFQLWKLFLLWRYACEWSRQ